MAEHDKTRQQLLDEVRALRERVARLERAEEALRESEQRFARFMHHLPGLAWIKDLDGRYVYANEAAMGIFRRPRDDLYGRTDQEIFPPETAAQFTENDRKAAAGGNGILTIETLEHDDGVVHHSIVSKFPILGPDGRTALVGGMAIDVTDRIRAEEALKETDRRKDEFLAMLAHELRNPLAALLNGLHILRQPSAGGPQLAVLRDMMERQVQHLARLVDDLLDVSRIMRGKVELRQEPLELATIITRAVETAQPFLAARGHRLTVTLPPAPVRLHGDLVRLAQVFANLLHNAAKYTGQGGTIQLAAELEGEDKARPATVAVCVTDNGVGIAPEVLPHVFDLFVQGDRSMERTWGGLGVGLTLVRRMVELHGGEVAASSAGLGRGSTFTVRLPVCGAGPSEDPSGGGQGSQARTDPCRSILVVDDNVDAAESLAMLLRLGGHEVRTAHSGPAALAAAADLRPDVVLLDIGMPGMNGYEVAERLRRQPGLEGVLLAAVTGYGQEEDRRRSREAGFDHHLTKPVDPDALARLLAEARHGGR